MTPQERKVFELALEALENTTPTGFNMETDKRFYEAITAIKESLSEPEQEPVAWTRKLFSPELGEFFDYKDGPFARETDSKGWTPLYTTPPQRKPLSDEQIEEIAEGYLVDYRIPAGCAWNFARDIEAAHNIKE